MKKKYNTPHRCHVVKTRMTEEEYADFTERLKHYDMSQAEFIRQAITRATIDNALYICLFAFTHRRTGNSVGYEPKRDNNTADFLMGFPTSWTCATADLPCNNDFITFATKPYIRYFLKEL